MINKNSSELSRISRLTPKRLGQDGSVGLWMSLARPSDIDLDTFSIHLAYSEYAGLDEVDKIAFLYYLQGESIELARKNELLVDELSTQLIEPTCRYNVIKHEFEHLEEVNRLHPNSQKNLAMRVTYSEKNEELRIAGYCLNWELPQLGIYENILVSAAPEILSMGDVILIEGLITHDWGKLTGKEQFDIKSRLTNRVTLSSNGQVEPLTYIEKVATLLEK